MDRHAIAQAMRDMQAETQAEIDRRRADGEDIDETDEISHRAEMLEWAADLIDGKPNRMPLDAEEAVWTLEDMTQDTTYDTRHADIADAIAILDEILEAAGASR